MRLPLDRAWLEEGELRIYVRKGPAHFHGSKVFCFTLANVVADEQGTEHTGRLRPVMEWMDQLLFSQRVEMLKVESVMCQRMVDICSKHGWWSSDEFFFEADGTPISSGSFWKWLGDRDVPPVYPVIV